MKYGTYRLSVPEGEVVRYSHVGFEPIEIIVEDLDRTLNIIMVPKINQLDAVTITKTRPRKTQKELFQDYSTNPNLIKTMFGILDKETVGFSLRILDTEDLNVWYPDLSYLLNNRFAQVRSVCNIETGLLETSMREVITLGLAGGNSSIYEVDGMIYEQLPCNFVDVSNIERIAVIPSFSGLTKYGTLAKGGIVIINTKTGNFSPGANGIAHYDQAEIRDNNYDNSAIQTPVDEAKLRSNVYRSTLVSKKLGAENPNYLNSLLESKNEIEAKEIYEEQLKIYGSMPYYILDAYDYFSNRWKNREFADSIIEQNKAILENNSHALKALAYIYQAEERFKKANDIYKEIFILRPNYAQSYIDLANSYREVEEYQKAAALYGRYAYLVEEGFLSTEGDLSTIMLRELNNLIALKGDKLVSKQEQKKVVKNDDFEGVRLVFEWNDSEAEFILQFVNPEGNYYLSEHSQKSDLERIMAEKISGFSCEEYLIYGFLRGEWRVNATYLGNKSLTPTYFKATVYHNYGSSSQRKKTKVFKLSLRNVNQQLFTVSNVGSVVSN